MENNETVSESTHLFQCKRLPANSYNKPIIVMYVLYWHSNYDWFWKIKQIIDDIICQTQMGWQSLSRKRQVNLLTVIFVWQVVEQVDLVVSVKIIHLTCHCIIRCCFHMMSLDDIGVWRYKEKVELGHVWLSLPFIDAIYIRGRIKNIKLYIVLNVYFSNTYAMDTR